MGSWYEALYGPVSSHMEQYLTSRSLILIRFCQTLSGMQVMKRQLPTRQLPSALITNTILKYNKN